MGEYFFHALVGEERSHTARGGAMFSELRGPGEVVVDYLPLPPPLHPPQKFEFARILWVVLLEARGVRTACGNPPPAAAPAPSSTKFHHKNNDLVAAKSKDFVILFWTVLIRLQSVANTGTDRQTNRRQDDS